MNLLSVSGPREGLQLIDFLGVVLYLLVTAGIVYRSSRRQGNTEEYFLGGRRMPWLAVGLSLLATLMSSISYMGVPGEMIGRGVAMFAQYLALPFSMAVVLLLWVPFFMRLQFTSAYEYLERRFDERVRATGSLLFLFLRLGWMSMVMYVGSLALTQMTGSLVPAEMRDSLLYWIIVGVGLSATVYSTFGGFRAAIWNDVLQSLMLLGGTLVTLLYVYWTTGTGPAEWWTITSAHSAKHTAPIIFSWDPTVRMTIVTAGMLSFFWTICTHGSDQVVLQRYVSTASLSAARRSYIVNALTDLTIGCLLALCGLALLAFYFQHPTFLPQDILSEVDGHVVVHHGDRVLPYFFAHQLPPGIGGVILAVLICDAMQTLVSGVNSISAVFTTDLFSRLQGKTWGWINDITFAKLLTVVVGLVVTALAVGVAYLAQNSKSNIIEMMGPAFNMFLGPLASLFLIGMFTRGNSQVVLISIVCSVVISFFWSYSGILFGPKYQMTITLTSGVPYLSSYLIAVILGLFIRSSPDDPRLQYTWRNVMQRPLPPERA
ncbi:MAG: sodium/solute symporter [Planctomycetales bacterium]